MPLSFSKIAEDDIVLHLVGESTQVFLILKDARFIFSLRLGQLLRLLLDGQQELANGRLEGRLEHMANGLYNVIVTLLENPA
jgi:hypothetical protein